MKNTSDQYDASMLYISDHGESLGENNLYLHGLPYSIAPDYQTKVPMLLWMSNNYQVSQGIDTHCVSSKSQDNLSHDYIFSSMLRLMDVETGVYNQDLDIFSNCIQSKLAKQ